MSTFQSGSGPECRSLLVAGMDFDNSAWHDLDMLVQESMPRRMLNRGERKPPFKERSQPLPTGLVSIAAATQSVPPQPLYPVPEACHCAPRKNRSPEMAFLGERRLQKG
jgi:hypothetical protein